MRYIGARVIVSDVREEKLRAAEELGVPKEDIVPVGKAVQEFVVERGLTGKIDTVLEFVGKNQTFEDAQRIGRFISLPIYLLGYADVMLTSISPTRRQNPLYRHAGPAQRSGHEERDPEAAELHLLVRWAAAGSGGGAGSDCARRDQSAGRKGPVGGLSEGAAGSV